MGANHFNRVTWGVQDPSKPDSKRKPYRQQQQQQQEPQFAVSGSPLICFAEQKVAVQDASSTYWQASHTIDIVMCTSRRSKA